MRASGARRTVGGSCSLRPSAAARRQTAAARCQATRLCARPCPPGRHTPCDAHVALTVQDGACTADGPVPCGTHRTPYHAQHARIQAAACMHACTAAHLEVDGVEVYDRRGVTAHELGACRRQARCGCGRQHRHQLLERRERLALHATHTVARYHTACCTVATVRLATDDMMQQTTCT